jgi:hypothetical protein
MAQSTGTVEIRSVDSNADLRSNWFRYSVIALDIVPNALRELIRRKWKARYNCEWRDDCNQGTLFIHGGTLPPYDCKLPGGFTGKANKKAVYYTHEDVPRLVGKGDCVLFNQFIASLQDRPKAPRFEGSRAINGKLMLRECLPDTLQEAEGFYSKNRVPKAVRYDHAPIAQHVRKKIEAGVLAEMDTTALSLMLIGEENHRLLERPTKRFGTIQKELRTSDPDLSEAEWVSCMVGLRNEAMAHRSSSEMHTAQYEESCRAVELFLKNLRLVGLLDDFEKARDPRNSLFGRAEELDQLWGIQEGIEAMREGQVAIEATLADKRRQKIHISYSREDSELLVKVQDATFKANWCVTGVLSNQTKDWFSAWRTGLEAADGVCVCFTEGNAIALNNSGVGYQEKLSSRFRDEGIDAALYREALAIIEIKVQRPTFKIYVVDGINYTPEQLAFNLINDAPSFGPVGKWQAFVEGGGCECEGAENGGGRVAAARQGHPPGGIVAVMCSHVPTIKDTLSNRSVAEVPRANRLQGEADVLVNAGAHLLWQKPDDSEASPKNYSEASTVNLRLSIEERNPCVVHIGGHNQGKGSDRLVGFYEGDDGDQLTELGPDELADVIIDASAVGAVHADAECALACVVIDACNSIRFAEALLKFAEESTIFQNNLRVVCWPHLTDDIICQRFSLGFYKLFGKRASNPRWLDLCFASGKMGIGHTTRKVRLTPELVRGDLPDVVIFEPPQLLDINSVAAAAAGVKSDKKEAGSGQWIVEVSSALDKEKFDKLLEIVEEFKPKLSHTQVAHNLQERYFKADAGQEEGGGWFADVGQSITEILGMAPEISWKIEFAIDQEKYSGGVKQLAQDRAAITRFLADLEELCGEGASISKLRDGSIIAHITSPIANYRRVYGQWQRLSQTSPHTAQLSKGAGATTSVADFAQISGFWGGGAVGEAGVAMAAALAAAGAAAAMGGAAAAMGMATATAASVAGPGYSGCTVVNFNSFMLRCGGFKVASVGLGDWIFVDTEPWSQLDKADAQRLKDKFSEHGLEHLLGVLLWEPLKYDYGSALKKIFASRSALAPINDTAPPTVPNEGAAGPAMWMNAYFTSKLVNSVGFDIGALSHDVAHHLEMRVINDTLAAIDQHVEQMQASLRVNSAKLNELANVVAGRWESKDLERKVRNLASVTGARNEMLQALVPLAVRHGGQDQARSFSQSTDVEQNRAKLVAFGKVHHALVLELYLYFLDHAEHQISMNDCHISMQCVLIAADLHLCMFTTRDVDMFNTETSVSDLFEQLSRLVGWFVWTTDLKAQRRSTIELSDMSQSLGVRFNGMFMPFRGQLAREIPSMLKIGFTMLLRDKDLARASFLRVLAVDPSNPTAQLALHLLDLHASAQEGRDEAQLKNEKTEHADRCLMSIAEAVRSSSSDSRPMHIIFLGMTDAGKSTLINSILSTQLKDFPQELQYGNNFLHVRQRQCTSVITEIRLGKQAYSLSRDKVRLGELVVGVIDLFLLLTVILVDGSSLSGRGQGQTDQRSCRGG